MTVEIVSFGYLHAPPPVAHLILDLRTLLRDPHLSVAMRDLTGLDPEVVANVMCQDSARQVVIELAMLVDTLTQTGTDPIRIAIGCSGGRHRSVVIAAAVDEELAYTGQIATLTHRDVTKPVVHRTEGGVSR